MLNHADRHTDVRFCQFLFIFLDFVSSFTSFGCSEWAIYGYNTEKVVAIKIQMSAKYPRCWNEMCVCALFRVEETCTREMCVFLGRSLTFYSSHLPFTFHKLFLPFFSHPLSDSLIFRLNGFSKIAEPKADTSQTQIAANATTNCRLLFNEFNALHW